MRRLVLSAVGVLALLALGPAGALAQGEAYTNEQLDYLIELPNATWRALPRTDSLHHHVEFIYGDRGDGLLRVRKEVVEAGVKAADLARRDQDQKFRYQAGYVEGREENFAGRLSGITTSYEFTGGGKPMLARLYYLQADPRTVYVLHFTGARDKLLRIRAQTDAMARSFRLK